MNSNFLKIENEIWNLLNLCCSKERKKTNIFGWYIYVFQRSFFRNIWRQNTYFHVRNIFSYILLPAMWRTEWTILCLISLKFSPSFISTCFKKMFSILRMSKHSTKHWIVLNCVFFLFLSGKLKDFLFMVTDFKLLILSFRKYEFYKLLSMVWFRTKQLKRKVQPLLIFFSLRFLLIIFYSFPLHPFTIKIETLL